MTLWHLMQADMRRHFHLLAVWVVVSVLLVTLSAVGPFLVLSREAAIALDMAGGFLRMAVFLLGVVLAPIVMQSHPLVGSTAFWMTRPVPPGALVASKLVLLAAALVVLPAAAASAAMVLLGMPPRSTALAAVSLLSMQACWLALAVAYGSLTQTLGRYLIAVGASLACLVGGLFLASAVALMRRFDEIQAHRWVPPTPTADLVGLALVTAALLAIPFVQATTRHRFRSIATGAAGVAAALLIGSAWAWPAFDPRRDPPAWSSGAAAGRLVAASTDVQADRTTYTTRSNTRWRNLRARARLHDVPPGWMGRVTLLGAELRLPDGLVLTSPARYGGTPLLEGSDEDPATHAIRAALGGARIGGSFPPRVESVPAFTLRDADFRRLVPSTGRYLGRFEVTPTHYQVEARLPLERGARSSHDAYRLEIVDVQLEPGGVALTAGEWAIWTTFSPLLHVDRQFYLFSARCDCAVQLHDDSGGLSYSTGVLPITVWSGGSSGPFNPRRRKLMYPPAQGFPRDDMAFDDAWIAESLLVVVRADTHAPFERVLAIDDFPLASPPPAPAEDDLQSR